MIGSDVGRDDPRGPPGPGGEPDGRDAERDGAQR